MTKLISKCILKSQSFDPPHALVFVFWKILISQKNIIWIRIGISNTTVPSWAECPLFVSSEMTGTPLPCQKMCQSTFRRYGTRTELRNFTFQRRLPCALLYNCDCDWVIVPCTPIAIFMSSMWIAVLLLVRTQLIFRVKHAYCFLFVFYWPKHAYCFFNCFLLAKICLLYIRANFQDKFPAWGSKVKFSILSVFLEIS